MIKIDTWFCGVAVGIWVSFAVMGGMMFAPSCGSSMDLTELARIRAITCPSVCAAYADAVDAGVEVTPEDEALIGVCECGNE